MLIGSDEPEEIVQLAWLEQVMAGAGSRGLAWFLHKPLFLDSPDEGDTGYRSVKPAPRRPLLALLRRCRVAPVASGHLHKRAISWTLEPDTSGRHPSAFLCGPSVQAEMPGDKRLGAASYRFEAADFHAEVVDVPGLTEHWIDDLIEEVYPLHLDSRPGNILITAIFC